jgi:glucose/mannose-6-phosphate isomerase
VSELSPSAIRAVDEACMIDVVGEQPEHLLDALRRALWTRIPINDYPGGMVVCGMGGSAIGADLAAAVIGDRARRPMRTIRGYDLEPWVDADTLVVCASYSGNTEETLSCYEQARVAGLPIVAITTGGELGRCADIHGVPAIRLPAGMQPRASVIYGLIAALECAHAAGVVPALHSEIERAVEQHERLVSEWGPEAPVYSQAKALALRLQGTVPVFYGAGPTAPLAFRWKAQLNENAELPAFCSVLPEADHNELCAWGRPGLAPLSAVFLDDPDIHPRVRRRIELTADLALDGASVVEHVESAGETPLERVLSLVLLGDYVSVYLAVLEGVDPTPVESIERFKAALA